MGEQGSQSRWGRLDARAAEPLAPGSGSRLRLEEAGRWPPRVGPACQDDVSRETHIEWPCDGIRVARPAAATVYWGTVT